MENQTEAHDQKEEKRVKKNIIWSVIFVFLFATLAYSALIWCIVNDKKDLKAANSNLLKEQGLNSTCTFKKDSLSKEVKQLSIYKPLTKAMVHRDEASSLLNYKVGDFVYLKRDSTKVLIEDIIMGGSKYQYYIKYKVLYKDKTTEEVIPELVY